MDLVQEPVRRLGHMSTKICSTCREYLHSEDYHPREWKKREKRTCTECRKKEQTIAAAPGIPSSSSEGQHGALSTHTPTPFDQHGAGASSKDAQSTATPVAASVAHAATPSSSDCNLARFGARSYGPPAFGGGKAPPTNTLPTAAHPTPNAVGGGAKRTDRESVNRLEQRAMEFRVSSVC